VLVEPAADDFLNDVIGDEFARGGAAANLGGQLGMTLYMPPENIADADMDEVEILAEHLRLRSLAAALNAHDDVFVHEDSL
jgi:hypothetical protein